MSSEIPSFEAIFSVAAIVLFKALAMLATGLFFLARALSLRPPAAARRHAETVRAEALQTASGAKRSDERRRTKCRSGWLLARRDHRARRRVSLPRALAGRGTGGEFVFRLADGPPGSAIDQD